MSKKNISGAKIDRQNILNNPYALENIQKEIRGLEFIEFENKMVITKQAVVEFFDVSEDTIDRALIEFSDELTKNGYEIITGKRLTDLKKAYDTRKFAGNIPSKTPRIGIFDFKAFLNLSMVLTGSDVAREMRTRILDIVISTMQEKVGKSKKYINQRDKTFLPSYLSNTEVRKEFTDCIKNCVEGNNNKYPYLTNLIYKSLFGENATEYRNLLKLGVRENLRGTFYREILDVISGYEEGISCAIQEEYKKKKRKLSIQETEIVMNECFNSPFLRVPRETARRLMASRDKVFREIIHDALMPYIEELPKEEYEKFLADDSKVIESKTKEFLELVDKHKDVFERLKDK
jgi:hypothetical protein